MALKTTTQAAKLPHRPICICEAPRLRLSIRIPAIVVRSKAHLCVEEDMTKNSEVDGDAVPVRHFGVILEWTEWQTLRERLEAAAVKFIIAPRIRFAGQAGEQATMFISDPSGNALEFKSFRDEAQVFASDTPAKT